MTEFAAPRECGEGGAKRISNGTSPQFPIIPLKQSSSEERARSLKPPIFGPHGILCEEPNGWGSRNFRKEMLLQSRHQNFNPRIKEAKLNMLPGASVV
jgi:hypothetical protein